MTRNEGFSLVELIIVIAIMAILSAALAPQLMRYIAKSKESTDKNNSEAIITVINTTLTSSKVYDEIMTAVNTSGNPEYVTFEFNGSKPTDYNINSLVNGHFDTELDDNVREWPSVKSDNAIKFYCRIKVNTGSKTIFKVEVQPASSNPFTP